MARLLLAGSELRRGGLSFLRSSSLAAAPPSSNHAFPHLLPSSPSSTSSLSSRSLSSSLLQQEPASPPTISLTKAMREIGPDVDPFVLRHIGVSESNHQKMCDKIGVESVEELVSKVLNKFPIFFLSSSSHLLFFFPLHKGNPPWHSV